MTELNKTVAAAVRRKRTALNISQGELSRQINVAGSTISFIEKGLTDPLFSTMVKLATFFECSIDDFWR